MSELAFYWNPAELSLTHIAKNSYSGNPVVICCLLLWHVTSQFCRWCVISNENYIIKIYPFTGNGDLAFTTIFPWFFCEILRETEWIMNWRDIFLPIKCDLQRMFVNLNFVVHPDCVFLSWKKIMAEQLQSDVMQTNIEAPQTASDRGKFLINRQFTTLKFKYWLQKSWFTMWIYGYSQINFSSQSFNMQNVIIFLTQF